MEEHHIGCLVLSHYLQTKIALHALKVLKCQTPVQAERLLYIAVLEARISLAWTLMRLIVSYRSVCR